MRNNNTSRHIFDDSVWGFLGRVDADGDKRALHLGHTVTRSPQMLPHNAQIIIDGIVMIC